MLYNQYKIFFQISNILSKTNPHKKIKIFPTSLGAGAFDNNHVNVISAFKENLNFLEENTQWQYTPKIYLHKFGASSVISNKEFFPNDSLNTNLNEYLKQVETFLSSKK